MLFLPRAPAAEPVAGLSPGRTHPPRLDALPASLCAYRCFVAPLPSVVRLSVIALALWLAGTALAWVVGVKLTHGTAEYATLLRVLAFAAAPKILVMFAVIPLGLAVWPLLFIVLGLTMWTTVLALRQALKVPIRKAMVVCLVKLAFAAALSALPHAWLGLGPSLPGLPDPKFRAPSHRPGTATTAPAPAHPRLPLGR